MHYCERRPTEFMYWLVAKAYWIYVLAGGRNDFEGDDLKSDSDDRHLQLLGFAIWRNYMLSVMIVISSLGIRHLA